MATVFALLVVLFNVALYGDRARARAQMPAGDRDHPLGLVDVTWAFAQECAALAAVILLVPAGWLMPRGRSARGTRGPVVLVPDRGLNAGSLWMLRHRLQRDGWGPVRCFTYGPLSVPVEAELDGLLAALDAARQPVAFVGHGFGGLVLRAYADRAPATHHGRMVTLGTPYAGAAEPVRGSRFDVIAIHSTFDARVAPASALHPGALNIQLSGVGHHTLLFSTRVYQLVAENLAAPLDKLRSCPATLA